MNEIRPLHSSRQQPVLVLGATGRVGVLIVQLLLDRKYRVRALVRNVEKAKNILAADTELVTGNVTDRRSVVAATDGTSQIIFCATAGRGEPENTAYSVDYKGVAAVVDAAEPGGQRIVLVSSASVTQLEHPHNVMFHRLLRWKYAGEQYLRGSGLPYTIIRPTGLRDGGDKQGIRLVQGDQIAFGEIISRVDVATLCVNALEAEAATKKTFEAFNDPLTPPGLEPNAFETLTVDAVANTCHGTTNGI